MALIGASKSKTSTSTAIKAFKDSLGFTVEGEINEKIALFRDSNKKTDRKRGFYHRSYLYIRVPIMFQQIYVFFLMQKYFGDFFLFISKNS